MTKNSSEEMLYKNDVNTSYRDNKHKTGGGWGNAEEEKKPVTFINNINSNSFDTFQLYRLLHIDLSRPTILYMLFRPYLVPNVSWYVRIRIRIRKVFIRSSQQVDTK